MDSHMLYLQIVSIGVNRCLKIFYFMVAKEISVDIIYIVNEKCTFCSTFTAVISLSLLLRR
jgi:hypothetical protein